MDSQISALRTACNVCVERTAQLASLQSELAELTAKLSRARSDSTDEFFPPSMRLSLARTMQLLHDRRIAVVHAISAAEPGVVVARDKVSKAVYHLYVSLVSIRDPMCRELEPGAKKCALAGSDTIAWSTGDLQMLTSAVDRIVERQSLTRM